MPEDFSNHDPEQLESNPAPERESVDEPGLPIDRHRQEIEELISQNDSAIVIGETGSGKTTRIPVILEEMYPGSRIAITQPRRIAATSVARFVARELGVRVGDEVGYQIRFEDRTTEGTNLNFQTDGILLRKLQNDPLLLDYDIVMVDEAHERSLNIDLLLGLLKRAQKERQRIGQPSLKIVVTSATIEREKFARYFDESPVAEIPGRMFPVDSNFEAAETRPTQIYTRTAEIVKEISDGGESGDILIFMPGAEEINQTINKIQE